MPSAGIFGSARYAPTTYSSILLSDSPGLYWRLGEASGATAADTSGNSRTGTIAGSLTYGSTGLVSGDADKAITFSGGNVERAQESWMDATTFTIEAIIKPSSVSSRYAIVSADGISGNRFWVFYVNSSKLGAFNNSNGGDFLAGGTTLSTGTAYHVALTSDGTNVKLYLNGVQDATTATALAAAGGATRTFSVGTSVAGGTITAKFFPFSGVIDEVAWYPSALSAARLLAHARAAGF